MKSDQSHKLRNALLTALLLILVSALAAAVTWAAYSQRVDDDINDTFTNTPNISVAMSMSAWDGYDDYGDHDEPAYEEAHEINGRIVTPDDPSVRTAPPYPLLGYHMAQHYQPHQAIPKNPTLKNTSEAITDDPDIERDTVVTHNEWVGVRVRYTLRLPKRVYVVTSIEDGVVRVNPYDNRLNSTTESRRKVLFYDSYDHFKAAAAQVSTANPAWDDAASAWASGKEPDGFNTEDTSGAWTDQSDSDSNGTFFVYNKILGVGDITNPLFNYVVTNNFQKETVKYWAGDQEVSLYKISVVGSTYQYSSTSYKPTSELLREGYPDFIYVESLPDFDIKLTPYAIQADNVNDVDSAAEILRNLRDANVQ